MGTPVTPPAMVGIVGGDGHARYVVTAARTMGYRTTVLDPDPDAPAATVADVHLVAPFDDPDALDAMATSCAVVTTMLSDPPLTALDRLRDRTFVHPSPGVLAICRDPETTRQFLAGIGAPHADESAQEPPSSARRLSTVVARTADGRTATYPVIEDQYLEGKLDLSFAPADVGTTGHTAAERLCTAIAAHLDIVGVLTVQMYVVDGRVLVSGLVPRPHTSGNLTIDSCGCDQYEQLLRSVCGVGLGSTQMAVRSAATANLFGTLWANGEPRWEHVLDDPNTHLHLYHSLAPDRDGGRPVGHLTVTSTAVKVATLTAQRLRTLSAQPGPT